MMAQAEPMRVKELDALCPTCHRASHFTKIGEQNWPPKVAEATGLPPLIHLYRCGECHTTVSHVDLSPDQ